MIGRAPSCALLCFSIFSNVFVLVTFSEGRLNRIVMHKWSYFLQNNGKSSKSVFSPHIFIQSVQYKQTVAQAWQANHLPSKQQQYFIIKSQLRTQALQFSKVAPKSCRKIRNMWKRKSLAARELKCRKGFLIHIKKELFKSYTIAHSLCLYPARLIAEIIKATKQIYKTHHFGVLQSLAEKFLQFLFTIKCFIQFFQRIK